MRFTGRVALITAAGRGIGRATAEIIGREGGTVVAVEVDKEALDQVVGAVRAAGGSAHGLVADALDGGQVAATVKRVVDEQGRIDGSGVGGVLPRFVLGRAAEGCVWRFRFDLPPDLVVALARLAGRERGASFDGELPAPPERLVALERLLSDPSGRLGEKANAPSTAHRMLVTREGVTVGELWPID